MIVIDTNVISEMLKPMPAPKVDRWLASQSFDSVFTTAITRAELLYGLHLMPEGRRKLELQAAITPILDIDFAARILPFDTHAADLYADLAAKRRRDGRPISQFDAQIAAIALSHGASLATRNIADFTGLGLILVDPWSL